MDYLSNAFGWVRDNFFPEENENSYGDGGYYTMFGGPPIHFNAALALVRNTEEAVTILPQQTDCKIKKSIIINQEAHILRHTVKIGSKYTKDNQDGQVGSTTPSIKDSNSENETKSTRVLSLEEEELQFSSKLHFKSHSDLKFHFSFDYIYGEAVRHIQFDLLTNPEIAKNSTTGRLDVTNELHKLSWSIDDSIFYSNSRSSIQIEDVENNDTNNPVAPQGESIFTTKSPEFVLSPKLIKNLEEVQNLDWRLIMKNRDADHAYFPVPMFLVLTTTLKSGEIHKEYTRIMLMVLRHKISRSPIDIEESSTIAQDDATLSTTTSPISTSYYVTTLDMSAEQTLEQPITVGDQSKVHIFNFSPLYSGSDEQSRLCAICFEGNADVVTLPCKHVHLCSECANVIRTSSEKCPICRSHIDSFVSLDPNMTPEDFMRPPSEGNNNEDTPNDIV